MRRWPSNIRSRQRRLRPSRAQRRDAQTHNRSSGKQSHRRRERGPRRNKLRKSYHLERARVSPEVEKYLAQSDQGFVAHEPHSQRARARWKRLPVRVSDARCPPTMPFPADPGKDSRFIGRAGMELVHAKDGNRPLVNVTAAEPRGWDDRAVTPCRPKESKNRLSEAFLRRSVRTSNNAASARSSRLAVTTRRRTTVRALRAPIE